MLMATYYLSYHELINMDPPKTYVPGPRVFMREEELCYYWIAQHRKSLERLTFTAEGTCHLDMCIRAFAHFPELIEHGDPGGG